MAQSSEGPVEVHSKTTGDKTSVKKRRLRTVSGYLHLLVSAEPNKLDILLLFVGIISSVAAGIPFPLLAIIFGQLVDELNSTSCKDEYAPSSTSSVAQKVLLTIYVTIANFVFIYISTGAWSLFGERLVRRLRYGYLRVLLQQEVSYFETLTTGEVSSRLDTDLHTIQAGVSEKAGIVIQSVSYFVTAYVVSLIKDAQLAGMLFALVPAYCIMVFAGNFFAKKYSSTLEEKMAAANAIASEALSHIKLVKAFGAAKRIESIFVGHLSSTTHAAVGKIVAAAVQMGLLYFIAYAANALAIAQGGRQIAESIEGSGSGLTVGAVYTVMLTLVDSSYIICNIAPFLSIFAAASRAADNIFSTMHRESRIDGSHEAQGRKLASIRGDVELSSVSFRYPTRREVAALDSLSLVIPAGKMTGIVGLSGSGKSTVAALVQRLYDPDKGYVLVDEQDASELHARHLRGFMGLVEQNPVLLNRSILENIAHGLVGSSREEHQALESTLTDGSLHELAEAVRNGGNLAQLSSRSAALRQIVTLVQEAATQSSARNFIDSLPDGLATLVGFGGGHLSGGQKQRVALARALIRNPSILVLDEATASLDSSTEALIQRALESLPGTRTTICIAHRLSTVKHADNIVVLQQGGKVAEQGTYESLMALNGVFATMVRLQTISGTGREASPGSSTTGGELEGPHETEKTAIFEQKGTVDKTADGGQDEDTKAKAYIVDEDRKRSFLSTFATIIKMARRQLSFIIAGVLAAVIVGGSHSGEAVIFGNSVASLNTCRTGSQVRDSASLFGLLFFVLAIVEFIANAASAAAFGWVADKLVRNIRMLVLRALLNQGLQWHDSEGRTPGTLMSYLSADATAMSGLTGTILGVTFSVLVTMLSGIILAHIMAWKLAIVLLACVPVIFLSGVLRLRIQANFAERHAKAFANSVGIATEAVTNIRTVSAYSLQDEAANAFSRSLKEPYKATLKNIAWGNVCLAAAFSVGSLVKALAYWWGAQLTARREFTQTQFFITLIALLAAAQTCGQLFSLSPDISKAAVAARRVLALIAPASKPGHDHEANRASDNEDEDPEKANGPAATQPRSPSNKDQGMAISFRNVCFSYPSRPSAQILNDVSFEIPPGSFVAFVGASGAGKSTIMSLLERFYHPSSGTINLDNFPLTKATSDDDEDPVILDDIGLVPQEPVLFSGSVAFNIGLGARPGTEAPSQAAIEAAARQACIHDTIAGLPQGYDTVCGPQGSQAFSGGQKQRICIARALLRKPRLLLLDESTSALDAESEALWEQALGDIMAKGADGKRKVTVVAIAHRLRTIMKADLIHVMDEGRIVDVGTHAELLERSDKYRQDVVLQTLE